MAGPAVASSTTVLPAVVSPGSVAAAADVPIAALVPVIVLLVAFVGYCLFDLSRSDVRYLPKWGWLIICLISVPMGGILYLILGRRQR